MKVDQYGAVGRGDVVYDCQASQRIVVPPPKSSPPDLCRCNITLSRTRLGSSCVCIAVLLGGSTARKRVLCKDLQGSHVRTQTY